MFCKRGEDGRVQVATESLRKTKRCAPARRGHLCTFVHLLPPISPGIQPLRLRPLSLSLLNPQWRARSARKLSRCHCVRKARIAPTRVCGGQFESQRRGCVGAGEPSGRIFGEHRISRLRGVRGVCWFSNALRKHQGFAQQPLELFCLPFSWTFFSAFRGVFLSLFADF